MDSPLNGKRVLNTRAPHQKKELTEQLTAWGADVVELPFIRVERVKNLALSQFREAFEAADVIVFTSRNGVEVTAALMKEAYRVKTGVPFFRKKVIAAVGEKTAESLKAFGVTPSIVPDVFEAGHLAESIVLSTEPGAHILYPRSEKARDTLVHVLEESGRYVTDIPVYTTVMQQVPAARLKELFENGGLDVITFASPSAVKSFFQQADSDFIPDDTMYAIIGSVTEEALREYVMPDRIIMPRRFTLEAMIKAIADYYNLKG